MKAQKATTIGEICAYNFFLLVAGIVLSSAASGQLELEELVVTAQKREQSLQDVPASVSVMSGESINDYVGSGENIRALAGRVPSLQVESSNGRQSPRFYIRGLGNIDFDVNASQPVSMILDDIALENSVLKSLPLFDVARVEVLKGPQGTLFGRNTPAGIVKIDTVRPAYETSAYTKAGYGSRETYFFEGAIGGQLAEKVASRLSLKYLDRGAWIDNTVNGSGDDFGGFDEFAYRLQFLFDPTDSLQALIKLHGFHQDGDQPQIFDGNPLLPRSPEWLYNVSLSYTVPLQAGAIYFNTDWNYRSESNIFLYESVEFVAEERWIGGVRVGYKNEGNNLDVAVIGRNITDEVVVDGALDFLNPTPFVNEPAFWGVESSYSF